MTSHPFSSQQPQLNWAMLTERHNSRRGIWQGIWAREGRGTWEGNEGENHKNSQGVPLTWSDNVQTSKALRRRWDYLTSDFWFISNGSMSTERTKALQLCIWYVGQASARWSITLYSRRFLLLSQFQLHDLLPLVPLLKQNLHWVLYFYVST